MSMLPTQMTRRITEGKIYTAAPAGEFLLLKKQVL
jgi:hypothetical protein